MSINILSLSGRIASGKDATTAAIQRLAGFDWENKKFAKKLKQIGTIMTGFPEEKFEDQEFKKTALPEVWNNEKGESLLVRTFLQRLGTEGMRNGVHTNAWVNALFADYDESRKWIISDTRFPNEAQAVKDRGGIVVRINRGEALPFEDLHPSETALDDWPFDFIIDNNGTLEELDWAVRTMLNHFKIPVYGTK